MPSSGRRMNSSSEDGFFSDTATWWLQWGIVLDSRVNSGLFYELISLRPERSPLSLTE